MSVAPVDVSTQQLATPKNTLSTFLIQLTHYLQNEPNSHKLQEYILTLDLYVKRAAGTFKVRLPTNLGTSQQEVEAARTLASLNRTFAQGDVEAPVAANAAAEDATAENSTAENTAGEDTAGRDGTAPNGTDTQSGDDRRSLCSSKLGKITMAFNDQVDAIALTATQHEFYSQLCALTLTVKVNNKEEKQRFTETEAADITNFFFIEMMGPASLRHLQSLVQIYNTKCETGTDRGAGARAEAAARNKNNIKIVRKFFGAFARTQRLQPSNKNKNELATVEQIVAYRELLLLYKRLTQLAECKDEQLLKSLQDAGYSTRQGITWQSCVTRFLSDQVGISRIVLTNTCQLALGVKALTDSFGTGIIPLLPPKAMARLNRWGNQRISAAVNLLTKHAPFINGVCSLIDKHVYMPITQGTPITLAQIQGSVHTPVLSQIASAVNRSRPCASTPPFRHEEVNDESQESCSYESGEEEGNEENIDKNQEGNGVNDGNKGAQEQNPVSDTDWESYDSDWEGMEDENRID